MVDDIDDEDLYEGFNYSIDLAPPQTSGEGGYQPSSYGAPASRGGFNPPGTAFRYELYNKRSIYCWLTLVKCKVPHLHKWDVKGYNPVLEQLDKVQESKLAQ
jgi:hypothetical protein